MLLKYIYSVLLIGFSRLCSANTIREYGFTEGTEERLRLHIVPATWRDALLHCQLEGSTLASPTTGALTQAMRLMMAANDLENRTTLTGMHSTNIKGDFISLEGILLSNISLPWAKGEPNNLNNDEDCLALTGNGELADVNCASVHPYFCYKHNPEMTESYSQTSDSQVSNCGASNNGYTWEPRTGSCYKFHHVARFWRHSAMVCTKESATLTVINSDVESQVLKELFVKNPPESHIGSDTNYLVHIGILDWNERGNWLTVFGDTLDEAGFKKWDHNEPNNFGNIEYCGSMAQNGLLNDSPCTSYKKAFICEMTPKQY